MRKREREEMGAQVWKVDDRRREKPGTLKKGGCGHDGTARGRGIVRRGWDCDTRS